MSSSSGNSGFPKVSFYGKKSKAPSLKARLNRREKEYKKWPAPAPYRPSLGGPGSCWKIFKTQSEAFDFARSNCAALCVYSCESDGFYSNKGQRLFLVTSREQLWHYYKQLNDSQRHHYEVIPEGSVCKLYFDLEFSKITNPERDGNVMVDIFITYIISQLEEMFHVKCTRQQILILDASTCEKFSQHVIFQLPNTAFKDNIHMGCFVQLIHNQLDKYLSSNDLEAPSDLDGPSDCKKSKLSVGSCVTEKSDGDSKIPDAATATSDGIPDSVLAASGLTLDQLRMLKVKDKYGKHMAFCDTGVYTKNRNFRLYLSCKLGRNNPLVLADSNQFTPPTHKLTSGLKPSHDEQIFLHSLVTNISYDSSMRILSMPDVPRPNQPRHNQTDSQIHTEQTDRDTLEGYHRSPYPEIDSYITSQLTRGGVAGCIRHWSYFSSGEILVYDVARNRWCGNIGRQHRSNNVIYIADLRRAVFYQKCHDPQCKAEGYKSPELPLPHDVLPAAYFTELDCELDCVDLGELSDADLLLAANQVEKTLGEVDQNKSDNIPDFDDDDDLLIQALDDVENFK